MFSPNNQLCFFSAYCFTDKMLNEIISCQAWIVFEAAFRTSSNTFLEICQAQTNMTDVVLDTFEWKADPLNLI